MTFTLEELIAIGRAASRQPDREFAPDELEFIHDVAHLAAEKASAKEREACDKWRQAIDHEMVIAHLGVANPEDSPAALLQKIIQWNVDIALDPAVSAGARALIEEEREAWRASLEPAFRGRMGSEQVREIVQSAIRARGTREGT